MSTNYYEDDYRPVKATVASGRFLPGYSIEVIRERTDHEPLRHALFDFDGTLSLIRQGWMEVMVPLMVEILMETGTDESPHAIETLVREFVMELTGKQTIYQMIRLAEEVQKRGRPPLEPNAYKCMYHDRLMKVIADRREALRSGSAHPDEMLVPGSRVLLDELRRRGVALYVASGTDEPYVIEEVRLLKLDEYFGPHVYGALDDLKAFSKAMVIERILRENNVPGAQLFGFGDGYVEIQNIKAVGGVAVAVASDEVERSGKPDAWKRERLIGAGADLVIPDYQDARALLDYLHV
jgi:phosphoglycolate phosphatase-like HAD superfamily hydrolase